jgi:hypothetical protein
MRDFRFWVAGPLVAFFVAPILFQTQVSLAADPEGRLGDLLQKTLDSVRAGTPNYSSMEPLTADAVEQGLPQTKRRLTALGAIKSVEYRGIQSTPSGDAETWRVRFENGTMNWLISVTPRGKILILWSPG